jgi:penicillin-insensitive murein endopeptidase
MIQFLKALALGLVLALPASADTPAKVLFGAVDLPTGGLPEVIGGYARGCIAGAAELPESGPTWQAMRLSRNRHFGDPSLVAFIERLSVKAAALKGWKGLYVGDMSQPRGGPMKTGHASHQIGLDVDLWTLPPASLNLTVDEREKISSLNLQRKGGAYVNFDWTPQHMALIKAAAEDPAVARIFIFAGAKVQMCNDARGDRSWLNKVRPWFGHNDHFHVRLNCPAGDSLCVDQAPPPPGDGCDEAQKWVDNILNPPPPPKDPAPPKPPLVLADLPSQCAAVLQAR